MSQSSQKVSSMSQEAASLEQVPAAYPGSQAAAVRSARAIPSPAPTASSSLEIHSAAPQAPDAQEAVVRPARVAPSPAPAAFSSSETAENIESYAGERARDSKPDERVATNAAAKRRRWLRPVLFAVLPIVFAGGAYAYVTGGRIMSTDDAYVNARQVGISTDVSGIVSDVDVHNNQYVSAGQVLYRLDPRQFQIALDNAKSNLAQIGLTLESMKQDYQQMLSDAESQRAQVELDQANYGREKALLLANAGTKQAYDLAQFTLATDASKLQALRQQAASELTKLDGNPNAPVKTLPQYLQAQAQVNEAQRELNHTVIRAPFAGTVTDVPSIAPGKYLAASTTAFFLVDTDHVWIDATPKETEITYVRPGQSARVTVDTYPHVVWHGTVESISPAAAQEFSLLPAQNTSGNWVKVVQRVPFRVRVDTRDKNMPPLRAGMSVIVDVDTGHTRGLSIF